MEPSSSEDNVSVAAAGFFHDPELFDVVEHQVMPKVIEHALAAGTDVRIWNTDCGTGETAYSLAMLAVQEAARVGAVDLSIHVFATDVDDAAIARGSRGVYGPQEASGLTEERRHRYLRPHPDGLEIDPSLRSKITFSRHDLVSDPPLSGIDLAMGRSGALQLHIGEVPATGVLSGVRTGGFLVFGPGESVGSLVPDLAEIDPRWRVYRKLGESAQQAPAQQAPAQQVPAQQSRSQQSRQTVRRPRGTAVRVASGQIHSTHTPDQRLLKAYDAILEGQFVGGVLLDDLHRLVHTVGIASEWMSPPIGRPSLDIFQLVDDAALRMAVSATLRSLEQAPNDVSTRPVLIPTASGPLAASLVGQRLRVGGVTYDLVHASPIETAADLPQLVHGTSAVGDVEHLERLESDLAFTRERLHAIIDEHVAAIVDLSEANTELAATNDELTSINHELVTATDRFEELVEENQHRIEVAAELASDLDQVLSEAEIGVIFLDEDLQVRRFNERAGHYFRVRENDIGRPLSDLVTHLDLADLVKIVATVHHQQRPMTRRVRLVNAPAANLALRVGTYRLSNGRPGVFIAVSDLADLIDLDQEQQRFLRFLDQAPIALFAKDDNGQYWFKNRLTELITGPGIGDTDSDLFAADLVGKIEADDKRVRDRQMPIHFFEGVPIDGEFRDFLTVKFPVEGGGIGGASLEIEHDGAADTIGRLQARLRAVARLSSLALIVTTASETIDVDDRYSKLTGFELDARFRSVHPDDRERTLDALDRRDAAIPCRLHLADGSWRHVEFRCIDADEDGGGEMITLVVDSHEAVEAAAKLTDDLAHLQSQMDHRTSKLQSNVSNLAERNADLDSFAHAAAHDLKAPLRAMMAFSELAAETIGEDHPARSFLSRIEQSSGRMAGMVDSLLKLASAGRDALAIRRCELEPIVQQVRNDLSLEIEQAGAIIEVGSLDPVLADPTALGVILTNLIANSVKYRSERTPRITVSSVSQDDHVVITVADNGIGFDQARAVEIFEPFRRLHSRDMFEGSGVGLAICRRLASRLDGEIWATAHAAGGATFSLQLPSPEPDR